MSAHVRPRKSRSSFIMMLALAPLVFSGFAPVPFSLPGFAAAESITIGDLSVPTSAAPTAVSVTLGGFDSAKSYIAVVGVTSGTVSVTSSTGISSSPNYAAPTTAASEISFFGLYDNVAAAIQTLRYHAPSSAATPTLRVELTERISSNDIFYWSEGQRYYKYVSSANSITWDDAETDAKSDANMLFGMRGYLATITTAAENTFIADKTTASNIWIGAGRKSDDATIGRTWQWLTGPETGTDFFIQAVDRDPNAQNGSPVDGRFSSWANGEPNGTHSGSSWNEDKAVTNWNNSKGSWNDLIGNSSSAKAYLIEYGGQGETSTQSNAVATKVLTVRANGGGTPQYPTIAVSAATSSGGANRDVSVGTFTVNNTACQVPEVTATVTTNLGTLSTTSVDSTITGQNTSQLSIRGSASNVQSTLNNVKLKGGAGVATVTTSLVPSINASVDSNTVQLFNPENGHYYRILKTTTASWSDALTQSEASTVCGVKGYLATITSTEENSFISQNALTTNLGDIWIGGQYFVNGGVDSYRWVGANNNGPLEEFNLPVYSFQSRTGIPAGPWQTGEPNYSSKPDSVMQLWFTNNSYGWDDVGQSSANRIFLTEYGNNTSFTASSASVQVTLSTFPSQVISWAPDSTTAQVGASPLVQGATASSANGGVISYSVQDAGATQCSVNSGTGSITFLTAGTCVIRVTASATETHEETFEDFTFTFTAAPASAAQQSPTPTPTPAPTSAPVGPAPTVRPSPSPAPVQASPAPAPQAPAIAPAPVPANVREPAATVGGRAVEVEASRPTANSLQIEAGQTRIGLAVAPGNGSVNESNGSPELNLKRDAPTQMQGSGMRPGSVVQVWLPSTSGTSIELARLEVARDGSYSGTVVFGSSLVAPLPIGPQVLQVMGTDSDGNRTVLNMNINVTQPDPAPELFRGQTVTPKPGFGNFEASNAGLPEQATLRAITDQKQALVEGDGWSLSLQLSGDGSGVTENADGVFMTLVPGDAASFGGSGFMPGTIASIWLFSDPTMLGEVTIAADGSFSGDTAPLDSAIATGEHTIQIQGVGEDGFIRSANMGVIVADPAVAAAPFPLIDWLPLGLLGLIAAAGIATVAVARSRRKPYVSNVIPIRRAA